VLDARLFREWLKMSVQWSRALREIAKGHGVAKVVRARTVRITVIDNPRVDLAHDIGLLSLDEVIDAVMEHPQLKFEKNNNDSRETRMLKFKERIIGIALQRDLGKREGKNAIKEMPNEIHPDKIHCESLLAARTQDDNASVFSHPVLCSDAGLRLLASASAAAICVIGILSCET
jgi:hypothetical protein